MVGNTAVQKCPGGSETEGEYIITIEPVKSDHLRL